MIILPLAAFILISLFLLKTTSLNKRLVFLWAALIWTLAAVGIVEGLSSFHSLTKAMVACSWGLVSLVALGCLIFFLKKTQEIKSYSFDRVSGWEVFGIFLTLSIICVVGINGLWAAPNNWDSMTYHLPRIMHWIENRSVEHYPTSILRQLYQPPAAEFLILHFQILAQNDRFANLIQWFSLLGTVLVVSLIAAELGARKKGQILAGFLTATIPMAILQGSSTQNDLVVGFWLVCFSYFALRLVKELQPTAIRLFDLLGASLSLALALLTKGSAYVFAVPWLAGFILLGFFKKRWIIFRDILIIVLICLSVNGGFYSRNIALFGAPLSAGNENYVNKGNVINNCLINVVRNASLHLGTPWPAVNNFLKEKILTLQSFLGKAENNSWSDFDILPPSNSEDVAGNPVHFLLISIIFAMILCSRDMPVFLRTYIMVVITGFLIFCIFFKWQLFHSRLHLPLFLMSMPIIACELEKIKPRWVVGIIVAICLLAAVPAIFFNERHPLLGKKNVFNMSRVEQYFSYRKFMALPYVLSAKYAVSQTSSAVGLLLGEDDWEYPLWVLLKNEKSDLRIYHVGVNNVSKPLLSAAIQDVGVIISEKDNPATLLSVNQRLYLKRQQFSFMSVYAKE